MHPSLLPRLSDEWKSSCLNMIIIIFKTNSIKWNGRKYNKKTVNY